MIVLTLGVAILEVGIVLGLESGVSFYKNWGLYTRF